jgi:hypothetical protein
MPDPQGAARTSGPAAQRPPRAGGELHVLRAAEGTTGTRVATAKALSGGGVGAVGSSGYRGDDAVLAAMRSA